MSPPGEFCTSRFGISPELHIFPSAAVGKAVNLRATVQLLPRVPEIPRPVCHEPHDVEASGESTASRCARHKSPEMSEDRGRSSSPRFTKPNVLSHMMPTQCLSASAASRFSGHEYSIGFLQTGQSDVGRQLSFATSVTGDAVDGGDGMSSLIVSKRTVATSNDLGAIAKHRFDLPMHSAVSNLAEVCCEVTFCAPSVSVTDRIAPCKVVSSTPAVPPQLLALQKSSPKAVHSASRRRSMPPKDGTDSDSSSPDIDAYLSSTLANCRLEPLSPQEMDVYLSNMYPQRMHKFKSVSSSFKLKSSEVADRSPRYLSTDAYVNRNESDTAAGSETGMLKYVGYRTPPCHHHSSATEVESEWNGVALETDKCDTELPNSDKCSASSVDDSVLDNSSSANDHAQCTQPGSAKRQLLYSKNETIQPKFLVGDEQVEERNPSEKSESMASSDVTQSPVLLHKSVSCPNKKALGASFQKANSLLKTVMMKKDLLASSITEVLFTYLYELRLNLVSYND